MNEIPLDITYEHSDQIGKLALAACKASLEFAPIIKDRVNPHLKNKYASLDAIITATRPALAKYELFVFQTLSGADSSAIRLATRLTHSSGQWLESKIPLLTLARGAQVFGAELTYMRRYARAAIIDVVAEEDDDGEVAQASKATKAELAGRATAQAANKAAEVKTGPKPASWTVHRPGGLDVACAGQSEWAEWWSRAQKEKDKLVLRELANANLASFKSLKAAGFAGVVDEVMTNIRQIIDAP